MARSPVRRWARWRFRNRTPTSSTSAWARPNCAATSCRATASTKPPTAGAPGSTWASRTRRQFRASASTPPIPTSSTWRRWAIPTVRIAERGVFRSKDGGATWQKILYRDDHAGAVDLCLDPHNPDVMFAAIWDVYRTPWSLSSGGTAQRPLQIHRWRRPLDRDHAQSRTALRHRRQDRRLGLGRAIPTASTPSWKTKTAACSSPTTPAPPGSWSATIAKCASAPSTTRASTPIPRSRTPSTCSTWASTSPPTAARPTAQLRPPHGDNHDLWIDPANPLRMIESNDGGGTVSINGGQTWTAAEFPTAQFYHVAVTNDIPYHICGAQQDSSTICVPSAGAARPRRTRRTAPPTARAAAKAATSRPIRKNPNIFYAGSQGALLTRSTGAPTTRKDVQVYPLFFSGENAGSLPERWQWTFPIVFSPVNPDILYTSSQHLWKTTDEGQTWQKISPDLTRDDPEDAGRFRRPHHARSERPRNLRHHLHHRALAQGREHHLDRVGRWPGANHARRRQEPGRTSRRRACPISAASA